MKRTRPFFAAFVIVMLCMTWLSPLPYAQEQGSSEGTSTQSSSGQMETNTTGDDGKDDAADTTDDATDDAGDATDDAVDDSADDVTDDGAGGEKTAPAATVPQGRTGGPVTSLPATGDGGGSLRITTRSCSS
jgi:cytoskeletal protein RodZ